ncbi:hypothetical protein ABBQ38_002267 [Trebouxia sp. C0009 RCD-2024]
MQVTSLAEEDAPTSSTAAEAPPVVPTVWRAGTDAMQEGEALDYDPTAYDCLHQVTLDWPCLSFDILKDDLGGPRSTFPHCMYIVAGTQAQSANQNYVALMRLSDIGQGRHGSKARNEDDDDMSDSDDEDAPPQIHTSRIAHYGGVNRLRCMPQQPAVVASWGDTGLVQIFDVSTQLVDLAQHNRQKPSSHSMQKAVPKQLHRHRTEGYALDWSGHTPGQLASGDCSNNIHVWQPTPEAKWTVSESYQGHTGSVEDLQWSPTEANVFASCSVDHSLRIWDTRERGRSMLSVNASDTDVNVISWNRMTSYILASGDEKGVLRVWDLRNFADGSHVANFDYHKGAITSVEWSHHESSILATTGSDDQLAVWDLALERDPEEEAALAAQTNALAPADLPAQLLFVHSGQHNMKEVHWHPQIPGMMVCTAEDGFNLFRPANL